VIRLFVAVAIPPEIGQALARRQHGLRGARWRPTRSLHITLRFIGDTPENQADDLDAKLKPVIWTLGLAIFILAVISGGIAWLIGRSISRPLGQLGARMRGLADGALDADIPGIERGDEVGAMAATVQIFKDNALRIRGLEKIEAETQQRSAAERRATMENIADDFERSVKGIVETVSIGALF